MYRYQLEKSPTAKLDTNRKRVEQCPCGKKNADGKFVPYQGCEDQGYCHSCDQTFPLGNHTCPRCKRPRALNLYIDTGNSNTYLGEGVGKCLYCDYHFTPKQFFEGLQIIDKPLGFVQPVLKAPAATPQVVQKADEPKPVSFVDTRLFEQSLRQYERNHFVTFLTNRYGAALAREAADRYFIGTSKKWPGATIFWQLDQAGNVRSGKIMLYEPVSGKRVKKPHEYITWVHKALSGADFNLKQCFFGLHQLNENPTKPVALCESEKTAIIGSICFPQFIWLAAGSKAGLSEEKCEDLKGRHGILLPDLNAFTEWQEKQRQIESLSGFTVYDLLQSSATEAEIKEGLDIADYLLQFPLSAFRSIIVNYASDEIEHLPSQHRLSSDFKGMIIQEARTRSKTHYDLLYTPDGELVMPGQQDLVVAAVNAFFEKNFVPAYLDGQSCFIHQYQ